MKITGKPQDIFEKVAEYLEKVKEEEVTVYISKKETKEMRNIYQNRFFYGLFAEIEKQTPFSSDTIKQYLLGRVFGKQEMFGELINRKTQTHKLTKKEAIEFINSILQFCEEHTLNIKYTSRDFQSLLATY